MLPGPTNVKDVTDFVAMVLAIHAMGGKFTEGGPEGVSTSYPQEAGGKPLRFIELKTE